MGTEGSGFGPEATIVGSEDSGLGSCDNHGAFVTHGRGLGGVMPWVPKARASVPLTES
jgi:hypothetical protein